jgi:hypothetical protein
MVSIMGRWWLIEIDKHGVKWAVSGSERVTYRSLFDSWKADINAAHALRN